MKSSIVLLLVSTGFALGFLIWPPAAQAQRDDRILAPQEMIQDLGDRLIEVGVDTRLGSALLAKLDAASRALDQGQSRVAVKNLRAFQRKVHGNRTLGMSRGIFIYTADSLSAQADLIVTAIINPEMLVAVADLVYRGGTIIRDPRVYITYWDWGVGHLDPDGERAALEGFLGAIGGTPYLDLVTQYWQIMPQYPYFDLAQNPAGILKGVWFDDENPMPTGKDLTTNEHYKWAEVKHIQKEVSRSVEHFGAHPDAIYFIVTPPDRRLFGWGGVLAYHSSCKTGAAKYSVAYADFPYQPDLWLAQKPGIGKVGATTIVAYHELVEAITDPRYGDNPTHEGAWYPANFGWLDNQGAEIADKCGDVDVFVPQDFAVGGQIFKVPALWSNAVHNCAYTYP